MKQTIIFVIKILSIDFDYSFVGIILDTIQAKKEYFVVVCYY